MKRKLYVAGLAVLALLGIYSFAAGRMLRGAGAYRMGTTLGTVLAQSRPYTALAAWILLVVLAVITVVCGRRMYAAGTLRLPARKKKEKAAEEAAADATAPMPQTAGGKIPPAGATVPMPAGPEEKIAPAAPAEPVEEKIPPVGATMPMPAGPEEKIAPAAPTERMEEPGEKTLSPAAPAEQPAAAPEVRFCMNCGAKLWAGQKFCSKCGTPVGGGVKG